MQVKRLKGENNTDHVRKGNQSIAHRTCDNDKAERIDPQEGSEGQREIRKTQAGYSGWKWDLQLTGFQLARSITGDRIGVVCYEGTLGNSDNAYTGMQAVCQNARSVYTIRDRGDPRNLYFLWRTFK